MKLLNRSIRSYLFYSIGILIISLPLFYFATKHLIDRDVDNSLRAQRTEIIAQIHRMANRDPFDFLDIFGPDIMFNRISIYRAHDSLYTVKKINPIDREPISYRILESNILISGVPYKIVLQNSLVSSEDLIKNMLLIILILLVFIVGGLLVINRVISGRLWRPFYKTLYSLRKFRVDGTEALSLPETDIEEFADLNKVAVTLTDTNRKVYESQKEFTENASHEMQTPLAILQGKLELLMQTDPLSEDQASLISDMADASQRMHRLNKSLLLLTKIDNRQFTEKETIDVDRVVEKLVAQFESVADQKSIRIETAIQDRFQLTANITMLEILISNLLSNAVRHNREHGKLIVNLTSRRLTVRNSGRAEALDQTKLFTRFQKDSADPNSIGLGLEIIRKICELNKFDIHYSFDGELHVFTVDF